MPETPESGATVRTSLTRRQVLAAGSAALVAAMAGCSGIVDSVAEQVLAEVNVFNELDRSVTGSVEVKGPNGGSVLKETFDLPSMDSDGESNFVAYDNVWENDGDYEVTVELTNAGSGSPSRAERTVSVEDTEEDMVGVSVGSEEASELITIRFGDSLTDFAQ